jgi:2-polyprenyl-6-methoxyphenol hydroxylase-like FAD-dependent oxidoreductase
MTDVHDVIVVGTRCAGAPAAMLLARRGYRVLAVDRATFPSDTVSTHILHPPAVAALARWGLLERLARTGCPPSRTYAFDFGPFTITGAPGAPEEPPTYCPRRTVLDKLLVDAAREAGAEVREGFTVDEIVSEDGRVTGIRGRSSSGTAATERATIVLGADGRHSLVAKLVKPEHYRERGPLNAGYYTYWSGLPTGGRLEFFMRPYRACAAIPTNDGLTLVIAGWPYAEFEARKNDVEGSYLSTIELVPALAERLRHARREARFVGATLANYFRKPYGPGWALVGDAGYNKDSITAQGILDAFRDAERCVEALDRHLGGGRPFDEVMAGYQRERDEHALPMYELTCQIATLEPPPPELAALFRAIAGNQRAMDAFVRMNAGGLSPAEFFAPDSVRTMLARAGTAPGAQPAAS